MTVEHRGYCIQQSDYNNHFMIIKDNKMVLHAQCDKKLSSEELKEQIDTFLELRGKIF